MNLDTAQDKFIQTWSSLGSQWGINKTMAQIHAFLLISSDAMSAEDIMTKLSISRGNVNMNVRELINWQLVRKEYKSGERKEYFIATKDIYEVAQHIIRERKKRELDPIKRIIEELQFVEGETSEELEEFRKVVGDINDLNKKADGLLNMILKSDQNWFTKSFIKFFTGFTK